MTGSGQSGGEPEGRSHEASPPATIAVDQALLDRAVGGWRGMIDSGVPTLVFVIAYVATGQSLRPSLVAAVVSGLLIAGWRLLRRESLQQVVTGFLGVAVSAFVASRTGRAENYFLLGLLTNVAYGMGLFVSILVRWPLIGVLVAYFRGQGSSWRLDPREYDTYLTATWIWVGMFGLRLVVQVPLFLAGWVGALGAAKLLMGWPMFLLAAYLTYRVVHPMLAEERAGAGTEPDPGDLPGAPQAEIG